jgi:hypothetical protein
MLPCGLRSGIYRCRSCMSVLLSRHVHAAPHMQRLPSKQQQERTGDGFSARAVCIPACSCAGLCDLLHHTTSATLGLHAAAADAVAEPKLGQVANQRSAQVQDRIKHSMPHIAGR